MLQKSKTLRGYASLAAFTLLALLMLVLWQLSGTAQAAPPAEPLAITASLPHGG